MKSGHQNWVSFCRKKLIEAVEVNLEGRDCREAKYHCSWPNLVLILTWQRAIKAADRMILEMKSKWVTQVRYCNHPKDPHQIKEGGTRGRTREGSMRRTRPNIIRFGDRGRGSLARRWAASRRRKWTLPRDTRRNAAAAW